MKKVTCCCCTYNRVTQPDRFVDEAVECFLRQDYPDKELVILNDTPGQTLLFDHPQVKVINTPRRAYCLAEKRNLCAKSGSGEVLIPWDDDDVYLPWAISSFVAALGEYPFVAVKGYWYSEKNTILKAIAGVHQNCVAYTREFFEKLAGYRIPLCANVDSDVNKRAGSSYREADVPSPFLIYRWGNGLHHLSGVMPKNDADRTQWIAAGNIPVQKGEFAIRPVWMRDYVEDVRAFDGREK